MHAINLDLHTDASSHYAHIVVLDRVDDADARKRRRKTTRRRGIIHIDQEMAGEPKRSAEEWVLQ
jgi:hypothetical protein